MNFNSKLYWEERLKRYPNLVGVGYIGRTKTFNYCLYKAKTWAMERILRKIDLKDYKAVKMLDIGTGTGFWIDYFLSKGVESILGVDIAANVIRDLRKKYRGSQNLIFVCSDIGTIFPWKGNFDFVIAMDVLYHIVENEDFNIAIRNISNALRPGGYLVFSDVLHSGKNEIRPQPHVCFRSLTQYEQQMKNNGLEIIQLASMYVLLLPTMGITKTLFHRILDFIYYKITFSLTHDPSPFPFMLENVYMTFLCSLDSLLTLVPKFAPSVKIAVARKHSERTVRL